MDSYISDLRANFQEELNLKIFRMNYLGIPQERISSRLGIARETVRDHLAEMPKLAFPPNTDLKKGFTSSQVAEKQGWSESLVWALKLDGKNDAAKYQKLQRGLLTWDDWKWTDCDKRFGEEWPGRIPEQLIAHILYYFSKPGDLVFYGKLLNEINNDIQQINFVDVFKRPPVDYLKVWGIFITNKTIKGLSPYPHKFGKIQDPTPMFSKGFSPQPDKSYFHGLSPLSYIVRRLILLY